MNTIKPVKTATRRARSLLYVMIAFTLVMALSLVPAAYAAAGSLDTSFGIGGQVTTDFGGNDFGNAVAVEPGGKIIVVGETNGNWALARYTINGTLDTSFGSNGDGRVSTLFGATDKAYAIAIQATTGKIVVAGTTGSDFALARYNNNGTLDTSFNSGAGSPLFPGMVTTDYSFSGSGDSGRAVAIQSDGKIVVAGYSYDSTEFDDFALLRYTSAGVLDTDFNSGGIVSGVPGIVITAIGSNTEDKASAVAIQSDGKIVVAGSSKLNFALARYTSAGLLDTTFDDDGKVTTDFGSDDAAYALALTSDNRIVVAGESKVNNAASSNCIISTGFGNPYCSYLDFSLARYASNGSLDTSFNSAAVSPLSPGMVTTPIDAHGNDDSGRGVAIQTDGKIVVAGYSETSVHDYSSPPDDKFSADNQFSLARYTSNGSLDTSFGTDGTAITDFVGSSDDKGSGVAIQTDGKIVVAGYSNFGDFALARYDTNVAAPLAISAITPASGLTTGGTSVTITGSGFLPGATVRFGGIPATDVVVVSSTSITARTPEHAPGVVDVVVINSNSQLGTLTNGYTYSTPDSTVFLPIVKS